MCHSFFWECICKQTQQTSSQIHWEGNGLKSRHHIRASQSPLLCVEGQYRLTADPFHLQYTSCTFPLFLYNIKHHLLHGIHLIHMTVEWKRQSWIALQKHIILVVQTEQLLHEKWDNVVCLHVHAGFCKMVKIWQLMRTRGICFCIYCASDHLLSLVSL